VGCPTPDDFRAKVFRDRERIGDWRVEKLSRSSAAETRDGAPSGTPTVNTGVR
jgi:hypothetical protein